MKNNLHPEKWERLQLIAYCKLHDIKVAQLEEAEHEQLVTAILKDEIDKE